MAWELTNSTYANVVRDDSRDRIRVEVGDASLTTFHPHLKMIRWDGEASLSVELPGSIGGATRTFDVATQTITWKRGIYTLKWYPHPDLDKHPDGALEFEIILAGKPATNKLTLNFDSYGLRAYYQGPLNAEPLPPGGVIADENHVYNKDGQVIVYRPPEIVGSYAVYFADPPRNVAGGKLYRTGKAFHVERPLLTDALGKTSWAALAIDGGAKTFTITADQTFLDTATYPIIIDPTFGYTSVGGTTGEYNPDTAIALGPYSPASNGTVDSISFYLRQLNLHTPVTLGVYNQTGGIRPGSLLVDTAGGEHNINGWCTQNTDSNPAVSSGTNYYVGLDVDNGNYYYNYDSIAGSHYFYESSTYSAGVLPNPFPGTGSNDVTGWRLSCYITYTESGAAPVTVNVNAATLSASGQALTVVPGAVSPVMGAGALAATGQAITVSAPPPAVSVSLNAASLTAAGQSVTVVPGARAVALNAGVITASGQAVTVVPGAVSVSLSSANLAASGQSATVVPGARSISLSAASLAASGQTITAMPGAVSTNLAAGAITASGQAATIVPGAVSLAMQAANISAAGQAVTVVAPAPGSVVVSLSAASLQAVGQTVTVIPGAVSISLAAAALAAQGQAVTVTGGVAVDLASALLTAAGGSVSVIPGGISVGLAEALLVAAGQSIAVRLGNLSAPPERTSTIGGSGRTVAVSARSRASTVPGSSRTIEVHR